MSEKKYRVNEIFYSIQGEGLRSGTANFFVRFSGCNLRCSMESGLKSPGGFDCDTEFVSGRHMTAAEILEFCDDLDSRCKSVIFTGGEPALQVDCELLALFALNSFFTCIETNGSIKLQEVVYDQLDWVTVSPKVAEHCIRQTEASEVKYVRRYGQGIPKTRVAAKHKFISPAFDASDLDPKTLAWCVDLVKQNPSWRLSVQQHKDWGVS